MLVPSHRRTGDRELLGSDDEAATAECAPARRDDAVGRTRKIDAKGKSCQRWRRNLLSASDLQSIQNNEAGWKPNRSSEPECKSLARQTLALWNAPHPADRVVARDGFYECKSIVDGYLCCTACGRSAGR